MRIGHLLRTAVLPLVAASAFAVPAHAVQSPANAARADQLFARATAMEEQSETREFARHMRRTARLYVASARLRDDADPLKLESLHRAGTLLAPLDPARASRLLGEAAELALRHGELVRTAHLYLDAAWAVAGQRSPSADQYHAATDYLRRARLLADAPLLSAQDREGILKRIKNPSAFAAR